MRMRLLIIIAFCISARAQILPGTPIPLTPRNFPIVIPDPAPPPGPVSFSGRVADPSGRPLEGARIQLRVFGPTPSANDRGKMYEATSNNNGDFLFPAIPSGNHQMFLNLTGYLPVIVGSPSQAAFVRLPPNQNTSNYRIILARQATVSGRVVSKRGKPVEHALVIPEMGGSPLDPRYGGLSLLPPNTQATDARGEYTLHLPPGKFKLKAILSYDKSFSPAYLPGEIELREGQRTTGTDFVIKAAADYSISGRILGLTEKGVAILELPGGSRLATAEANGEFRIEPVTPGEYTLWASDSGQHRSNRIAVSVRNRDITGVKLTVRPILEVSGTIKGTPLQPYALLRLEFVAARGDRSTGFGITPDRSFTLRNLPPDRYRFSLDEPGNTYIREMTVNGVPIRDPFTSFVELTNTADNRPRITLVAAPGAELHGAINGASSALVLLVPEGGGRDQAFEIKAEEGKYQLRGIRPGKYRIVAITTTSANASFIDEALQRAESIEIPAPGNVTRNLTPINRP